MIFYSILKCLASVQEEDRQKKTKKPPMAPLKLFLQKLDFK